MRRAVRTLLLLIVGAGILLVSGCKHKPSNPNLIPDDLTILCVGDSITAGTHGVGDSGTLTYPGLLSDRLQAYHKGIQVVNEGQNGWQVTDVAQNIAAWVQPVSPRIILLQIGTNDLEHGVSPEETGHRLGLLITQIETLSPNSHLYVASATPVRSDNKPKLALSTLAAFNRFVPRVVRGHQHRHHYLVFVDLYKRAGMTGSDLGPDGEHPDDSGYRKMADFWFNTLVEHEANQVR